MSASCLKHLRQAVPVWTHAMILCSSEGIMISDLVSLFRELLSISFFVFKDRYRISSDVDLPNKGSLLLKSTNEKPDGVFKFLQVQYPLMRSFDCAIERDTSRMPSFLR